MKNIICIPARLDSSRFPGKLLEQVTEDKRVIDFPIQAALESHLADEIYVLCASKQLFDYVQSRYDYSNFAIMSDASAYNGTERILNHKNLIEGSNVVINLQADEVMTTSEELDYLIAKGITVNSERNVDVITLAQFQKNQESIHDVYVTMTNENKAMYFSRCKIPFLAKTYIKHIGIYAFLPSFFLRHFWIGKTRLYTEQLEQLIWLENGARILVSLNNTDEIRIAINDENDLEMFKQLLKEGEKRK